MTDSNILDKVIEMQEDQKRAELIPQELVSFVLQDLNSREQEVIRARYGLDRSDTLTLEAIGQKYGITRERVRQIENNALKKALQTEGLSGKLTDIASIVVKHIHKGGFIRLEDSLMDELLEGSQDTEIDKNCLRFLFSKFLVDHVEPVDVVHTDRAWKVRERNVDHYQPVVDGIKDILSKKDEPMHLKDILEHLEKDVLDDKLKELISDIENWENAVHSYLEVSKHFKKNLFDKWGLNHWRSVNPKRMRDKIHLVMQKSKEPMHYKVIAEAINSEKFDNKKAHPATIHNELILDDRFVLIGRGIYALKEWGYKPGVISDVIEEILRDVGVPLTKEEIMKEVLKRRMVKEGSVNLTLANKDKFERDLEGAYKIKQSA
jgi:DNA-directed RNA polymerase delta subunit